MKSLLTLRKSALLVTVTFNATVVKDNFETKARDHAVYGSLDNAEAELQAEAISAKATTASGGNLAYTATADATAAKVTDSTAVEPLSADGEVGVEAAEVNFETKARDHVVCAGKAAVDATTLAALKATVVIVEAKFEATVEPLSAADEIAVEAVDVNSD